MAVQPVAPIAPVSTITTINSPTISTTTITTIRLFYFLILLVGLFTIPYILCTTTNCFAFYQTWLPQLPQIYMSALEKQPLLVKGWSSFLLFGVSDTFAQIIFEKSVQWVRTLWFSIWGLVFATPMMHFWYQFLDTMYNTNSLIGTLFMAMTDQGVFTPTYAILYYMYDSLTKGSGAIDGIRRFRKEGKRVVLNTWCFWLPANLLNFTLVPLEMRVLYVSSLAIPWNVYFSFITQKNARAFPVPAADIEKADPKTFI